MSTKHFPVFSNQQTASCYSWISLSQTMDEDGRNQRPDLKIKNKKQNNTDLPLSNSSHLFLQITNYRWWLKWDQMFVFWFFFLIAVWQLSLCEQRERGKFPLLDHHLARIRSLFAGYDLERSGRWASGLLLLTSSWSCLDPWSRLPATSATQLAFRPQSHGQSYLQGAPGLEEAALLGDLRPLPPAGFQL